MIVTAVEAVDVRIPHPEPFESCLFPGIKNASYEACVLRIETDEGIVGVSSNRDRWWDDPDPYAASKPSLSRQLIETYVRRYLIGKDPLRIEHHMQQMVHGLRMFHGYPWFVEFALWDLVGKRAGLPVHQLFGGGKDRIRAYCSTATLYEPEEMEDRLRPLMERGFTAIKLRAHREDYRRDVLAVEAARDAVGTSVHLMVDANQSNMPAYGLVPGAVPAPQWDLRAAFAFGKGIEELGITWLEDPLPGSDMEGLADLRRRLDVPIAGAETEIGARRYRELCQHGCFDIVQPDAAFSGGMLETWKIGAVAAAFGVQCVPHIWGTAHSVAANLQLAAVLPNCDWMECPHDPPGYPLETRDVLLSEPVGPDRTGFVQIPQRPGLGVETDWDAVDRYRVG